MNRGISRLTSDQMRARAVAYSKAAIWLASYGSPDVTEAIQAKEAAEHLDSLAAMWGRRADAGPVKTKRRPKTFKPFTVRLNQPHNGIPAGSAIEVSAKWRHFYRGTWASMCGTAIVRVPKAACSIA